MTLNLLCLSQSKVNNSTDHEILHPKLELRTAGMYKLLISVGCIICHTVIHEYDIIDKDYIFVKWNH